MNITCRASNDSSARRSATDDGVKYRAEHQYRASFARLPRTITACAAPRSRSLRPPPASAAPVRMARRVTSLVGRQIAQATRRGSGAARHRVVTHGKRLSSRRAAAQQHKSKSLGGAGGTISDDKYRSAASTAIASKEYQKSAWKTIYQ